MHFYGDARTRRAIRVKEPMVLLYGGFEGFENYGDVLQLTSTISFHRKTTGLRPILVVSLASCLSADVPEQLRAKYDVDGVIFEDGELLDVSALELEPLTDVQAGALLHVYGGGYFNRYWGARRAFVCEQLIFRLHVADYVMSGLQVDDVGAAQLEKLFSLKRPLVIGGRDARSVELLKSVSPPDAVEFSFDDAIESIEVIQEQLARADGWANTPRHAIGLHANITREYMSPDQAGAVETAFSAVIRRWPERPLTMLQAYNDRRGLVQDTLETISTLDILGRLTSFGVVDLATLSAHPAPGPLELTALARSLAAIDVVVACSYHVSLTMNLLERPTFLIASNDYYAAKRAALGLPVSIDQFLDDPLPSSTDYADERRRRRQWLDRLTQTIAGRHGRQKRAKIIRERQEIVAGVAEKYFLS